MITISRETERERDAHLPIELSANAIIVMKHLVNRGPRRNQEEGLGQLQMARTYSNYLF